MKLLKTFIFIFCFLLSSVCAAKNERVLLKDVKSVRLEIGKETNHRRVPSIHQLHCVRGSACHTNYEPEVVVCENLGSDGDDHNMNWKCSGQVEDKVVFLPMTVICEGYDFPDDEFILVGSCGLEYELNYRKGAPLIAAFVAATVIALFIILCACTIIKRLRSDNPVPVEGEMGNGATQQTSWFFGSPYGSSVHHHHHHHSGSRSSSYSRPSTTVSTGFAKTGRR